MADGGGRSNRASHCRMSVPVSRPRDRGTTYTHKLFFCAIDRPRRGSVPPNPGAVGGTFDAAPLERRARGEQGTWGTRAGSSRRPGHPRRLSQNRTSAVHIRLVGAAGCDPRGRPVFDLDLSQCQRELHRGDECPGSGHPGVSQRHQAQRTKVRVVETTMYCGAVTERPVGPASYRDAPSSHPGRHPKTDQSLDDRQLRLPVAQLDRAQPSSDVRVQMPQRALDPLSADPEEAKPPAQVDVHCRDARRQRPAPATWGQREDLGVDARSGALRQGHL